MRPTRPTRPTARRAVAVLAAACALLTVTACTATTGSTTPPVSTPIEDTAASSTAAAPAPPVLVDPATVDTTAPEQLAETVAIASVTWDTTVHTTEYDAIRALSTLLTPELAAQYPEPDPGAHPASDPRWAQARELAAFSIPQVYTAQPTHTPPADTDQTIYRAYEATWTWHGTTGQSLRDPRTRLIFITAQRQPDGQWLIAGLDITDI